MVRIERNGLDVCVCFQAPGRLQELEKGRGTKNDLIKVVYGLLELLPQRSWSDFYSQIINVCKIIHAADIAHELCNKPTCKVKWGYIESDLFEIQIRFDSDTKASFFKDELISYIHMHYDKHEI